MKLLAIDTCAKTASIALLEEDTLLAEYFVNLNLTHSQTLLPMCEHLLQGAGLAPAGLGCIAVTNGPGSFTGLRIGISAAKGLAFAGSTPCMPVSALDSLACNIPDFDGIICAVMDARCGQVYHSRYRRTQTSLEKLCPDTALRADELLDALKSYREPVILVGDGADLCYNSWVNSGLDLRLCGTAVRFHRAASTGLAAMDSLRSGTKPVSPGALMPSYLRLPQAERELKKRQTPGKRSKLHETGNRL